MATVQAVLNSASSSGTANALYVKQGTHDNLNLNANLQVANSDVGSTNAVPTTLTGRTAQVVTIANAVNITDTSSHNYALVADGGMTEAEVRQYKQFRISIYDTHTNAGGTATATIRLQVKQEAKNATFSESGKVYLQSADIQDGDYDLMYAPQAGGTGASGQYKAVPALEGVMSNLLVRVVFAATPDSGALTIKVEMVK